MHNQLSMKKCMTPKINALYKKVKENYSDFVLEDIDFAVMQKVHREDSDC